MLELLKTSGYELPPRETDFSELPTKEIMDKIKEFMDNANPKYELLVFDFWQLIADYPVSMCERKMSDTLKLLITLYYFWKPPRVHTEYLDMDERECARLSERELKKVLMAKVTDKLQSEHQFSYEELGIIFMRSKASIHDAIQEREAEIKQLVEEVNMRSHARSVAFQEMVREEKLNLLAK